MSHVILLCADRPLPLYDSHTRRVRAEGSVTVERDGFSVQANEYYRAAVEELDFPMKPCRYELDRGRLEDLDGDALAPLEGWNVCMTVER